MYHSLPQIPQEQPPHNKPGLLEPAHQEQTALSHPLLEVGSTHLLTALHLRGAYPLMA